MKPEFLTCGEDNLQGLYAVFNATTSLCMHLNNHTGYFPKVDDLVHYYFPKLIKPSISCGSGSGNQNTFGN